MKKVLAAAGIGAALFAASVATTGVASAASPDGRFLTCLAVGWGQSSDDVSGSLWWGHRIANDISSDLRSPIQERDYVYYTSDVRTMVQANVMVNCATSTYLGFGPPLA